MVQATIAIPVKSQLSTNAIRPKKAMMPAAHEIPYFKTVPLRGRAIGDLPLPPHSGHTPVPEQCAHSGRVEFK